MQKHGLYRVVSRRVESVQVRSSQVKGCFMIEHGSEEWHAARKGRVTSSVAAAVLGLDPDMTPLQAWMSITGRERFDGNKATVRGTVLEPVVLDYPTLGGELKRTPARFVGPEGAWWGDSSDCLYHGDDLFVGEGKTVAQGLVGRWGDDGTDEVPDKVLVQSLWHLHAWPETRACIVPVLFGGYKFEFRQYSVERDADLIGDIVERCERWHRDHVVADRPPEATAGDDDGLKYLWPKHVPDKWIDPTSELAQLVAEYIDARDAAKQAESAKKSASARLRQILGDAEGSRGMDDSGAPFKVTHKLQSGKLVTNWEAIARELGATDQDIQRHTGSGEGCRVLRCTRPKKG